MSAIAPAKQLPFRCPLCGSTIFEQVAVRRPGGAYTPTQAYQCAGCTVMFRDPERFTRRAVYAPGEGREPRRLGPMPRE